MRPYLQFCLGIRSDSYILPYPDVAVLREEAGEIRLEVATLFRLDTTMVKLPVRERWKSGKPKYAREAKNESVGIDNGVLFC